MARITAAKRQENKEKYDAIVLRCFFENGWDYITLNNMAKEFGIGKSSVQAYYPSKTDFGDALKGKVFPAMMKHLSFSDPKAFKHSWEQGLSDRTFKMVVHLLVSNATREDTNQMTVAGIQRLKHLLTEQWGDEQAAVDSLHWVLGISVIELAKNGNT
jgi:AcrR family transcriptional regulator